MKNAEHDLRASLTDSLQHSLTGLNEKHTKKLRKTVDRAVKVLARKFAKLTAKELKGNKKAVPKAAPVVHALPKPAIRATRTTAKRPVAAKAATEA